MTTCPDFDRLALDADALAVHLDTCPTCAEALADLDDDPVAELAVLRDLRCPPEVVAGALQRARQAPDRPARVAPARQRRRSPYVWAVPMLAIVIALAWWAQMPTETAVLAEARPGQASPAPPSEAPDPVSVEVPPDARPATPDLATTTVAPAVPPRTRRSSRVPSSRPAPLPAHEAEDAALPTDAIASEVSPADSAAAVDGLRLALAVVGDARRDAADVVAEELARPREALAYSISRP